MTKQPKKAFDKNQSLEALSSEINSYLSDFDKARNQPTKPKLPPLFIIGAPRSGTTLVFQALASTMAFAFPSNLMSRFYGSLRFASMVHLLLADKDYDFQDEFSDVSRKVGFESSLGKTKGLTQPNEFWYFWRRFFALSVPSKLTKTELECVDSEKFVSELAEMESTFKRPVVMKAMILCFNLAYLHSKMSNAIFLHIKRDLFSNARSLLKARERYYGSLNDWYSTKPVEYSLLKQRSPFEQVLGQVQVTNREIGRQLTDLPRDNSIEIDYEDFCANPGEVLDELSLKYSKFGYELPYAKRQIQPFTCRNPREDSSWENELLEAKISLKNLGIM